MAEKFIPDSELSASELASHLRCPSGTKGKEIGFEMNKANSIFCLNTYKQLKPVNGNNILELGMGNGYFTKDLLAMANDILVTGVDYSETMVSESQRINKEFVDNGSAKFIQASIDNLPFLDSSFDLFTTTNTVYFWPNPEENAKEIFRILKNKGKALIAYRDRSCLDNLEFGKYGFEKYDSKKVEQILINAGFSNVYTETIAEPDLDFDGEVLPMKGFFTHGNKL